MTKKELTFHSLYNEIEERNKQSAIRISVLLGDNPHTEEFANTILSQRRKQHDDRIEQMRVRDVNRFSCEYDSDRVFVRPDLAESLKPTWSKLFNNHFALPRLSQ